MTWPHGCVCKSRAFADDWMNKRQHRQRCATLSLVSRTNVLNKCFYYLIISCLQQCETPGSAFSKPRFDKVKRSECEAKPGTVHYSISSL